MTLRRSHGAAVMTAALFALVLLVLSSTLVGGKIFSSADNIFLYAPFSANRPLGWIQPSNLLLTDPLDGFIPDLLRARSDLSHGVLPLWNPDAGGGRPLFASQVDAFLFPLTWLTFVIPFFSSFAWIAALKLLLAAAGTHLFVRDLGLRRGPALLAAVAFSFGMFFVVWLEHPQTYVWLCMPWMLLATRRICARGSLGATGLLGLSTGLAWLGGHPESAAFLMAVTAFYAAFELIVEWRTGTAADSERVSWAGPAWTGSILNRAGLNAIGLLLGVGLGWVTSGPLLELLQQSGSSNRGGPALPMGAVWSFLFPEYWGMPNKLSSRLGMGPVNFNERTAYFGALPLLLAVGAFGRRCPREVWFFLGLAVFSFALTFNVPLLATAIRKLPDGDVARLTRFLIVLSFCGAVLAAYGLQRWLTGATRERDRMMAAMGIVALAPPLFWMVSHHGQLSVLGAALRQLPTLHFAQDSAPVVRLASVWRWTLTCALGLGGLGLVRLRCWPPLVAIAVVLVLTALDLGTLDRGYHGAISRSQALPRAPQAIRYLQTHQGERRIFGTDFAMPPDIPVSYGLRDARVGIDIPYPSRFVDLWTGLQGINGDQDYIFGASPDAHRLADLFAARYALVPPGGAQPSWLRPILRTAGGTIEVNQTALPRAWVAYQWRPASGQREDLAMTLASSTVTSRSRPVIEGVSPPPAHAGGAGSSPARVTDDNTEQVTVRATPRRPGYLMLDDSAYPGWTATVNGRRTAWHPANENFRAVAIPAGADTIIFRYQPSSVRDGAIVSLLSLAALLGLTVAGGLSVRRRRARRA